MTKSADQKFAGRDAETASAVWLKIRTGRMTGPEVAVQLVVLFFLTSALLIAGEWYLSRAMAMVLHACKLYAILLALACAAGLVWRKVQSIEIIAVGATAYLVLALRLRSEWLLVPLILASVSYLPFMNLRTIGRSLFKAQVWLGAAAAAALILCVTHYGDFLVIEKLREGTIHQDTLYHASVSSMIKTYGVASTGVNGLAGLPSHVLSHQVLAALSILSGVHVLELYGIVEIVILCPLLLLAVAWCAVHLSGSRSPSAAMRAWLVVCTVLIVLKVLPLEKWAAWDSYFVSESYTLSLFYFVLSIPLLASVDLTLVGRILAGILILLAGLSNGAVGVVGIAVFWVHVLVLPGQVGRGRAGIVAAVTTAMFLLFMMTPGRQIADGSALDPFFYVQQFSWGGEALRDALRTLAGGRAPGAGLMFKSFLAVGSYLLVNFVVSWIVVLRRTAVCGARGLRLNPDGLFSSIGIMIGVAALMFKTQGVWYAVNPAMFIALPFAVAGLAQRVDLFSKAVRRIIMMGVLLIIGFMLVDNYQPDYQAGLFWKYRRVLGRSAFKGTDPIVDALITLRDPKRSHPVVFEPDMSFPRPQTERWYCAKVPFIYPATTEQAWVGVIDVDGGCPFYLYGYPAYFVGMSRILAAPVIPRNVTIVRVGTGAVQHGVGAVSPIWLAPQDLSRRP